MVDREMRGGGEETRADEERGGATLPGSGRRAGRCARPEGECSQTTDPASPTGLVSPKSVHICSKGSDVAFAAKKKPHDSAVLLLATEDLSAPLLQIGTSMAPSGLLLRFPVTLDGCTTASRSPGQLGQFAARAGPRAAWTC